MNTRKHGVDESQSEGHDIASINQFDAVSDGAHRDVDPVVPRIEPIVPRVETVEVGGVEVRPTVQLKPSHQTIRKANPPEPSADRLIQNEMLFSAGPDGRPAQKSSQASGQRIDGTPSRAAIKADELEKSRMADEGGFDPPAWEARTTTHVKGRGRLEHRARVIAIRVLERLEHEIHKLVCRLSGPEADPAGGPSSR